MFYANINILSGKYSEWSPDVKCTLFKAFVQISIVLQCGIIALLLL